MGAVISLHQDAGDAGTSDLRNRLGQSQPAVSGKDVLARDKRGQVRLVGHVEQDGQDAAGHRNQVEVSDGQPVQHRCQRDDAQHHGAPQIGGNQDWPSTQTVHPGSGEEAKYKYGRRTRSGKESHLKRRRFEDENGSEGQADASDVGSDLRDRLADPQLAEIGIEPKPVARHFSSVTQVY